MNSFYRRPVLSLRDFSRDDLDLLYAVADNISDLKIAGSRTGILGGRILVSAFFDRSTRTRLAHESAMIRLGGSVIGFASGETTRAAAADGESLTDTLRTLAHYGDVIVSRHPATGLLAAAAKSLPVPVINGGDGAGEHPTQTMTDLYAIRSSLGAIDGTNILLVNDLRMRCVRSLVRGLRKYPSCTIHVLAEAQHRLPHDLVSECAGAAQKLVAHPDIAGALRAADVVYCSPTIGVDDLERTTLRTRAEPDCVLTKRLLDDATVSSPTTPMVLHPLPRGPELDQRIDGSKYEGYWDQVAYGVTIRMALLTLMLHPTIPRVDERVVPTHVHPLLHST